MPGGFFGLLEQEQVVPLQNCSQDSLTWDLAGRGSGHGKNLMANPAAYSGLRWGELIALTIPQVRADTRVITVGRKVVEVAGHLYVEAAKNSNRRRRICPRRTSGGALPRSA
jgi:hypothetical protein